MEGWTQITLQITQFTAYLEVQLSLIASHCVHCDRGEQKLGRCFSLTALERQMSEKENRNSQQAMHLQELSRVWTQRTEPIIINKHDYVNRTWVIILFPPRYYWWQRYRLRLLFPLSYYLSQPFLFFYSLVYLSPPRSKLITHPLLQHPECWCMLSQRCSKDKGGQPSGLLYAARTLHRKSFQQPSQKLKNMSIMNIITHSKRHRRCWFLTCHVVS